MFVTQHYHCRNLTDTLSLHLTTLVGYETKEKATWLWLFPRTQNAPNSLLTANSLQTIKEKFITVNSVLYSLHREDWDPDMARNINMGLPKSM